VEAAASAPSPLLARQAGDRPRDPRLEGTPVPHGLRQRLPMLAIRSRAERILRESFEGILRYVNG
jgi:hypothetical protein